MSDSEPLPTPVEAAAAESLADENALLRERVRHLEAEVARLEALLEVLQPPVVELDPLQLAILAQFFDADFLDVSSIASRMGLGTGIARHHIAILNERGLIESASTPGEADLPAKYRITADGQLRHVRGR